MAKRILIAILVLLLALAAAGCSAETEAVRATAEAAGEKLATVAQQAGATVEAAGGTAIAGAGATVEAVRGDDSEDEEDEKTEVRAQATEPAPTAAVTGTVQVELPQVTTGGQPATRAPEVPAGAGGDAEQTVTELWAALQAGDVEGALAYWALDREDQPAGYVETARGLMQGWAGGGHTLEVLETSHGGLVNGHYLQMPADDPAATQGIVETQIDGEPAIFSLVKTDAGWRVVAVMVPGG